MNLDIILVLAILVLAFILFVSERIRMDVVALMVMSALALTGLVTPVQALAGFSNPAVITVWAMFILSAALTQTGFADALGRSMLSLSGRGEATTAAVLMLTAGVLSAFMNNIGVAALMLPVAMNIARSTGLSPSRLLMPLAFGSLLGGLTTLIGTPPNLLVSNALKEAGSEPFRMFDFAPVGGVVLVVGTAFVVLIGRRFLPERDPGRETRPRDAADLGNVYEVDRQSAVLRIPENSGLDGTALTETRLGIATGLNVYAIVRNGSVEVAPAPTSVLRAGDRLLVHGRLKRFEELRAWRDLIVQRQNLGLEHLLTPDVDLREVEIQAESKLIGQTIGDADLRKRFGVIVLALRHGGSVVTRGLADVHLERDDTLLVYGTHDGLERLRNALDCPVDATDSDALAGKYAVEDRIFTVVVPEESALVGSNLLVSRLGDALGAGVVALVRGANRHQVPVSDQTLQAGDELIVRGDLADLEGFRALQQLELVEEKSSGTSLIESEGLQLVETMLAPRSSLAGHSLRELRFRERYGLSVLARLRGGQVKHSNLGQASIELGDALLCVGTAEDASLLAQDEDFLVLNMEARRRPRTLQTWAAGTVMLAVVGSVLMGWLPISIASVAGATMMVLLGCLSMEDAYRAIEWRSVFLIAGMLPLGTAMADSGAAAFVASGLVSLLSPLGPWGVVGGLYFMTAVLTSVVPTAALVVLVAPIVLDSAASLGLSEHALMMAVAMAASASFTSPISHPANVMVMGPGGYRFVDYVKVGAPLTLVVMVVVMLVLPIFWPLEG